MKKQKQPWEASSWEELKQLTTLDEVKRALKQRETQRLAHKKYYLKRQALLQKAREMGLDKDIK